MLRYFFPSRPQQESPRVILITGCSSGIGKALVLELASRGDDVRVCASARSLKSLEYAKALKNVDLFAIDVTRRETIEKALTTIIDRHAKIDMVINNAGNELFGPLVELDVDKFRQQFECNVVAPLVVAQCCAKYMIKQRFGTIVNVGSVQGEVAIPFSAAYSASKFAVHAVSDGLRIELRPFGVDVVVLAPGAVQSDLATKAGAFSDIERYQSSVTSHYSRCYDDIFKRAHHTRSSCYNYCRFIHNCTDCFNRQRFSVDVCETSLRSPARATTITIHLFGQMEHHPTIYEAICSVVLAGLYSFCQVWLDETVQMKHQATHSVLFATVAEQTVVIQL
jgi:short-subunit dehydrogenase